MSLSIGEQQASSLVMETPVTLNKREMARKLRVSLPTMTAWMDRWPDFPVEQRGTNGSSYRFRPDLVFEFLDLKRREEADASSIRDEQLQNLQLVFDDLLPPPEVEKSYKRLTPKEEIDVWKLRELKRKEAERCGQLVIATELQEQLRDAFSRLSQDTRLFIRKLGRKNGWPDSTIREAEQQFEDTQRASVAALLQILQAEPEDGERSLTFS